MQHFTSYTDTQAKMGLKHRGWRSRVTLDQAETEKAGALHLLLHQKLLCQELFLQLLLLKRLQLLELDLHRHR